MPFTTTWTEGLVTQKFYGVLSTEDRNNAQREVIEDPRFDTMRHWIIDSLDIQKYTLDYEDAEDAAGDDIGAAYSNGRVRIAFAVTNEDHIKNIYHFVQFIEDSGSPWKVGIFDNFHSAKHWAESSETP